MIARAQGGAETAGKPLPARGVYGVLNGGYRGVKWRGRKGAKAVGKPPDAGMFFWCISFGFYPLG